MLSAAASWGWGQKEHSGRGLLRTVYKRKTLRLFNSRASQLTFLTHRKKHLEPGRTMITHFVDCNLVLCLRCPLPISPNGQFQKERPVPRGPGRACPPPSPWQGLAEGQGQRLLNWRWLISLSFGPGKLPASCVPSFSVLSSFLILPLIKPALDREAEGGDTSQQNQEWNPVRRNKDRGLLILMCGHLKHCHTVHIT